MKSRWTLAVTALARTPSALAAVLVVLLAVLPGVPSGDARAGDSTQTIKELQDLLSSLNDAKDPGDRKKLVDQLSRTTNIRAAERLRRIARTDPDPSVRVAAIQALGRIQVPEALEFLLELVDLGGPHDVRQAHGRAIAQRHGCDALVKLFEKPRDDLGHGLLLAALAEDPSLEAGGALERFARSTDPYMRCEAMRNLARHPAGRQLIPDVLREVLKKYHDLDTVLAGLDVAESLADADFVPLADLLSSFLEPEVQNAVDAVRRRLAYLEKAEAAKLAKKAGEYATAAEPPPDPPTPRPRVDIVYMFDASGSVTGYLDMIKERIRREARTLARVGTDYRVGVIAYRDTVARRETWPIRVLPLTYDLLRAEAFIDTISPKGCGSGAAITDALEQGMDRMSWRWTALRQVGLIADSKTGDVDNSREIVRLHYQSDRTRLHVWYLYRTRPQLPADVEELAKIGGGVVESLE